MDVFLFAFLTAQAFVILCWKISLKFFCRFEVPTDILVTVAMALLFMGTVSGMLIAIIGGLIFSIELRLLRRWHGPVSEWLAAKREQTGPFVDQGREKMSRVRNFFLHRYQPR